MAQLKIIDSIIMSEIIDSIIMSEIIDIYLWSHHRVIFIKFIIFNITFSNIKIL